MNGQCKKGKDDALYLVISDEDDVFKITYNLYNLDILESIKNEITEKTWDDLEYDKGYMKIKFENNNILPVNKDVNIHIVTIVIRAIFAKDILKYP